METKELKPLKVYSNLFDKVQLRKIQTDINRQFNEYTECNELKTILVQVIYKDKSEDSDWVTIPKNRKSKEIEVIKTFEVDQIIECLN